jgi:hypothetical protein
MLSDGRVFRVKQTQHFLEPLPKELMALASLIARWPR